MAHIITDSNSDDVVVNEHRDNSIDRGPERAGTMNVGSLILTVIAVLVALYLLTMLL